MEHIRTSERTFHVSDIIKERVLTIIQSDFEYSYPIDTVRGIVYNIGVRLDPSINNVESFAVVLFFGLPNGDRVEVAKVDSSPHEGESDIHVDRYYREVGAEIKDFDQDIHSWDEAEQYMKENWNRFVDTHYRNHGGGPREDGKNV